MAEFNSPEQFEQYLRAMAEQYESGYISAKTYNDALRDAAVGVRGYSQALRQSFTQLGTAAKQLGKDLYSGKDGAAVFNETIKGTADAASVLLLRFGALGVVLGGVIKVGAAYVAAVNKQQDQLYKSFQEISKTGTIGAGGMREVFDSMQKFGYALDELGNMQALLAKNAQSLARFGGTAFAGANQLANLAEALQNGQLGERFRNMGLSVNEINENAAAYIAQQVQLGQRRADIERNLTSATTAYIDEVVAVQKLTGQSREQLEEKQRDAMNEQAFAYRQYQLKKRMDAGDAAAGAEYRRNEELNRVLEGEMRKEMLGAIAGDTARASKMLMTAPEAFNALMNQGSMADVMNAYARGVKRSVDAFGPLTAFNAANFIYDMKEVLPFMTQFGEENYEALKDSAKVNSETTDKGTKSATDLRMAQMNTRQAFEDLVNFGINPVTAAMSGLADMIEGITSFFGGKKRTGKGTDTRGYGATGTGTLGGSLKSTTAGAATGAAIGSVVPVVGTAIGTFVGGALGYIGYQIGGGTGQNPEDLIEFGGESGSRSAFDRLSPDVQKALMGAAGQYLEQSGGKKLRLNSAFRDPQKQKELYDAWIARGKTGMPVAPPGTSLHEQGRAIDIEQGKGDRMAIAALNNAGLFQTVPNDPVHFAPQGGGYAYGGIAMGPSSGYQALLHGTEAVVPLPDGRTIPVQSSAQDSGVMAAQLDKLDEMVSIMKNQLNVSTRIMQYSS